LEEKKEEEEQNKEKEEEGKKRGREEEKEKKKRRRRGATYLVLITNFPYSILLTYNHQMYFVSELPSTCFIHTTILYNYFC